MRRAFALAFLAAVALAACVPALPGGALEENLDGAAAGPGTAGASGGTTGSGAAGASGGTTGSGAAGASGGSGGGIAGADAGNGGDGGADAGVPPPPFIVLVANAGTPQNLAADAEFVYWTNHATKTLMKAPVQGGAPVALAPSGPFNGWVALDPQNVYFTSGAGTNATDLFRVPKNGGTPTRVAGSSSINQIAVTRDGVFWTNSDGTVMKVGLSGGTSALLVSGQNSPGPIAVDSSSVYWVTVDGNAMKTGLSGGPPIHLGAWLPADPLNPRPYKALPSMAVDATYVYWGQIDGPVVKVGLNGGQPDFAFAFGNARQASSVAADATGLYYGDVTGVVHSFPAASPGFSWTFGDGGGRASALTTDAANIYWYVEGRDSILKAPK